MIDRKIICVVDRGNISRSPIAVVFIKQELLNRDLTQEYIVGSFRTQGYAPDDTEAPAFPNLIHYKKQFSLARSWLEKHDIDLSGSYSTAISRWVAEKASVIFAMDKRTRESLLKMFPDCANKIHFISEIVDRENEIIDPETIEDRQQLEYIFDGIRTMIKDGFPKILALANETRQTNIELVRNSQKER